MSWPPRRCVRRIRKTCTDRSSGEYTPENHAERRGRGDRRSKRSLPSLRHGFPRAAQGTLFRSGLYQMEVDFLWRGCGRWMPVEEIAPERLRRIRDFRSVGHCGGTDDLGVRASQKHVPPSWVRRRRERHVRERVHRPFTDGATRADGKTCDAEETFASTTWRPRTSISCGCLRHMGGCAWITSTRTRHLTRSSTVRHRHDAWKWSRWGRWWSVRLAELELGRGLQDSTQCSRLIPNCTRRYPRERWEIDPGNLHRGRAALPAPMSEGMRDWSTPTTYGRRRACEHGAPTDPRLARSNLGESPQRCDHARDRAPAATSPISTTSRPRTQ